MKFEEKNSISIPIGNENLIYFLIQDNEVVYVGKTSIGLIRPFTHKDKIYNRLEIINCNYEDLDFLEDKYIKKYKPKYNKQLNYEINYSIDKIKNKLFNIFNKKINLSKIKKAIEKNNIQTINYNNGIFIQKGDFDKIVNYLKLNERI